jgi:hypothetical protein
MSGVARSASNPAARQPRTDLTQWEGAPYHAGRKLLPPYVFWRSAADASVHRSPAEWRRSYRGHFIWGRCGWQKLWRLAAAPVVEMAGLNSFHSTLLGWF